MALIGYVRVSDSDQNLAVQLEKLKNCDKLFQDEHTGRSRKRPQLVECLNYVREGDTLVVTRLDRMGRSVRHLCQIAEQLKAQQVELKVLDQDIDTGTITGRLLFHVLGAIAEYEVDMIAERQRDGIESARARGVHLGKKKSLTDEQCTELRQRRQDGALIKTLMKDYKISKPTVYRYLKKHT